MRGIKIKSGYIFQFSTESDCHGYCQCLPHDERVFLVSTAEDLPMKDIVNLPVAFRVRILPHELAKHGWKKLGSAPIPPEYMIEQDYAYRDYYTGRHFLVRNGYKIPASIHEVSGLEPWMVWWPSDIVERLLAQLAGKPSTHLEKRHTKKR